MKLQGSRKSSIVSIPKNKSEEKLNLSSLKKSIDIKREHGSEEKKSEKRRNSYKSTSNIFMKQSKNQEKEIESDQDLNKKDEESKNNQEMKDDKTTEQQQQSRLNRTAKEEDIDQINIAKFYAEENTINNDKIYIYFIVYSFDIVMKIFVCNEYHNNSNMHNYLAAQVMFILLERIVKMIVNTAFLQVPILLLWNLAFLDYMAIIRYEAWRQQQRNHNLYNAIVKRIDIIITFKIVESCILAGPSLLLTLSAIVNDSINTSYLLSAISSLATVILANKEIGDFQVIQCRFNSLTHELRQKFEQSYENHFKDFSTNLINILAQAGLWMLCTQIRQFILAHAFFSFLYITMVTFFCTYKSLGSNRKSQNQNRNTQVNIKVVAAVFGLFLSFFMFILLYTVFFFIKIKKRLYTQFLENSENQNKTLKVAIEFMKKHNQNFGKRKKSNEEPTQIKVPPMNVVFYDYKFYQFSIMFRAFEAYRLYCIISTIIMIILDSNRNDTSGSFLLVRIVSYACSIIMFFHVFQMKRDYNLYKSIKNEKYLQIHLNKLLRKANIDKAKLEFLQKNDGVNVLPNDIVHANYDDNSNSDIDPIKEDEQNEQNENENEQQDKDLNIDRSPQQQLSNPDLEALV